MNSRSWGVILLKLMGLYYMLEAVYGVLQLVMDAFGPPIEGWPNPRVFAAVSLTWVLILVGFSTLCLFVTDPLADWLFESDDPVQDGNNSPVELIRVGFVLMGIYFVAVNVTTVMWFLAETLWLLEGSRRAVFREFFVQSWRDFSSSLGPMVVGVILCLRNREIATFVWKQPLRSAGSEPS